jgi:hypothetical protein
MIFLRRHLFVVTREVVLAHSVLLARRVVVANAMQGRSLVKERPYILGI